MAETTSIRGVKIKLEGDASGLITALKRTNTEINQTQRYLNDIHKLLKLDPTNKELGRQGFQYLQKEITDCRTKLAELQKLQYEYAPTVNNSSKEAQEAYNAIKREIVATEQKLKDLIEQQKQLKIDNSIIKHWGDTLKSYGDKIDTVAEKLRTLQRYSSLATDYSIKSFADFESAFAGVRKTVDATEEEFATLQSDIRTMATNTASSAEDIAAVMEVAGQLGIANKDLTEFTKTMVMLGDSTNLAADEGAISLAKFLNITGTSSEEIGRVGAAIVDLGNNYATMEQDIVDMSFYLASAGTAAGLSAQEILGLATAMSSAGIKAASGGSSMMKTLRTLDLGTNELDKWSAAFDELTSGLELPTEKLDELQGIAKQIAENEISAEEATARLTSEFGMSEESANTFAASMDSLSKNGKFVLNVTDKLGVSAKSFSKTFRTQPIEALKQFIKMLNNTYEDGDSLYVLMEELGLTEIRQSNMLRALSISYENFDGAIQTANKAYSENTALVTEANKRYATFDSQFKQAKEKVKLLASELGEKMLPTVIKLLDMADGFLDLWSSLSPEMQQGIALSVLFTSKIASMTKAVGSLVSGFGSFLTGAVKLGVGLTSLSAPVGLAVAGFTALAGVVGIVASSWDDLGNSEKAVQKIYDTLPSIQEYKDSIYNLSVEFERLRKATENEIVVADVKVKGIKDSWTRLKNMVDENGKIKKGFEEQAKIVADSLNKALGTSLEIVEGEVKGYEDVAKNIDTIIAKKKAELYLNAFADDYTAALKSQAEMQKNIAGLLDDREQTLNRLNEIEKEREEIESSNGKKNHTRLEALRLDYLAYEQKLKDTNAALHMATGEYEKYATTIDNYSNVTSVAMTGSQSTIESALLKLKYNFIDSSTATKEQLEAQAKNFRDQYDQMKRAAKDGVAGITKEQVAELRTLVELSDVELKKFDDALAKHIGNPIKSYIGQAKKWGSDFVDEFASGISSGTDRQREAMTRPAKIIYKEMHFSVPDEGPMKDADTWGPDFVKLYAEGIKNNAWRVKDEAVKLSQSVATTMAGSTQFGIAANGFNPNSVVNQYSNSMGNVSFVINATENQSVYEIANAVDEMLADRYSRAERAFAR